MKVVTQCVLYIQLSRTSNTLSRTSNYQEHATIKNMQHTIKNMLLSRTCNTPSSHRHSYLATSQYCDAHHAPSMSCLGEARHLPTPLTVTFIDDYASMQVRGLYSHTAVQWNEDDECIVLCDGAIVWDTTRDNSGSNTYSLSRTLPQREVAKTSKE